MFQASCAPTRNRVCSGQPPLSSQRPAEFSRCSRLPPPPPAGPSRRRTPTPRSCRPPRRWSDTGAVPAADSRSPEKGRPSKTQGRPSKTKGRPSKTKGRPSKTTGRPSKTKGRPSKAKGRPSKAKGRPLKTKGRPSTRTRRALGAGEGSLAADSRATPGPAHLDPLLQGICLRPLRHAYVLKLHDCASFEKALFSCC